jgi:bla regulator protein BlaR1
MIPTDLSPLVNHLWQSTLCAAAVWLLTLALRKNRAAVRYWLWLAASVKFLLPFSLLVSIGSQFAWHTTQPIKQPQWFLLMEFGQRFAVSSPLSRSSLSSPTHSPVPLILFGVWLVGFGVGVLSWLRRWQHVRTAVRHATPLQLATMIPVLSCSDRLEPGVFGTLGQYCCFLRASHAA